MGKYVCQGVKCSFGAWVVPGICIAKGRREEVEGRYPFFFLLANLRYQGHTGHYDGKLQE